MTPEQWEKEIAQAAQNRPAAVRMETFHKRYGSDSRPSVLSDADGKTYVVKALIDTKPHLSRVLVNDQVIARIGVVLGMPVGTPVLTDVPQSLIDKEPELRDQDPIRSGIAHATHEIPGCSDKMQLGLNNSGPNVERYAALAPFYGLFPGSDHQIIIENAEPRLIHSVDHGHFFAGGPSWTLDSLKNAPIAVPDASVISSCGLSDSQVKQKCAVLSTLTDRDIAGAVSIPPDSWNFPMSERVALADYLAKRRDALIAHGKC